MSYETLEKVFWKTPDIYMQEYEQRFNSPFAEHIEIDIQQYNRRKSFPTFFCYTKEISLLLERIFSEHQKVIKIISKIPPIVLNQFFLLCILDEVKSSNDIEGVRSTRKELKDAMNNPSVKSRFQSTLNKYHVLLESDAMDIVDSAKLRQFYDESIYDEVLADNPNNALDGKVFRRGSVEIEHTTGKTIHKGIYPEEKIIDYVEKMLLFAHNEEVSIIVRTAICHYLFAYIHPFYDGNGRTARMISSYALTKVLDKAVTMRLSICIKKNKNKNKYYKLLSQTDSEHNCGDLTPFVIGFLEIIIQTIRDTYNLLNRKNAQFVKNMSIVRAISKDALTADIYEALFQASLLFGRGISIVDLEKHLGKSRNTIMNRLKNIPPEHIIVNNFQRQKYYKLNMMMLRDYTA